MVDAVLVDFVDNIVFSATFSNKNFDFFQLLAIKYMVNFQLLA